MSRAKGRRVMANADETKNVDFYAVFDGKHGRPEGFYLDMKERHDAEDVRAKMEGRSPNHDDEGSLSAAVGTMLVIEEQRVDNRLYANPAIVHMESKDVDPVETLPVNVGEVDERVDLGHAAQVARERSAQDEALLSETNDDTNQDDNTEPGESPSDLLKNTPQSTTDTSA